MNRSAPLFAGANGHRAGRRGRPRRGFTLLEMCIVLFIIALLVGAMMPSMETALTEQAIRGDSHQLAVMVKTAMYQSSEQHRAYVIDFTTTSMALHPAGQTPDAVGPTSFADDNSSSTNTAPEDVEMSCQLNPPNKLIVPDPKKEHAWVEMSATSWLFQPGELCPAQTVRFTRGNAWLELNFNLLTGDVENEGAYFP